MPARQQRLQGLEPEALPADGALWLRPCSRRSQRPLDAAVGSWKPGGGGRWCLGPPQRPVPTGAPTWEKAGRVGRPAAGRQCAGPSCTQAGLVWSGQVGGRTEHCVQRRGAHPLQAGRPAASPSKQQRLLQPGLRGASPSAGSPGLRAARIRPLSARSRQGRRRAALSGGLLAAAARRALPPALNRRTLSRRAASCELRSAACAGRHAWSAHCQADGGAVRGVEGCAGSAAGAGAQGAGWAPVEPS